MTPLYKKGNKSTPGNYRPVSLTSVVCNVLESIIKDAIMEHLEQHKLIEVSQHGFIPGRSCLTNLLLFAMIRSVVKPFKVLDVNVVAALMSNQSALTCMTDLTPKKTWSDLTMVLDG